MAAWIASRWASAARSSSVPSMSKSRSMVALVFSIAVAFDDDTALRPAADGAYEGAIADGWWTPRGPLGGYVMAIVLRGMQLAVGDDARRPRSVTMHFLRPPVLGPVVVRPVVERAGRSLTTV